MARIKEFDKILLVEDDKYLAYIIKKNLESIGFSVSMKHNGKEGLEEIMANEYSLLLLDISLPEMSGIEIVRKVKAQNMTTPILIITNHDTQENELVSFREGANIFHEKPINFELLKTQVKSLLEFHATQPPIQIGPLYIDPQRKFIMKEKDEIHLSEKEFQLLLALIAAKGKVQSRQELLSKTGSRVFDLEEGSIDTLVCRLRRKLKEKNLDDFIETVYREGYRVPPIFF